MARVLRAEIDGLSIAYDRTGSGPALVVLHGFLFDSRAWRPQLEGLSNDFMVIAWDAPGAGQSHDPPETFELADWADCLGGLLDVAGVESAHILGLSWGGILAQELYRRRPQRVQSLVLADTYAGWGGSLSESIVEERLAACLRDSSLPAGELVPKYLPGMHIDSAARKIRDELASIMSAFHPVGFRLMALSSARSDTRDLLPEIRVPTLLIWGEKDARSSLSVAIRCRPRFPAQSSRSSRAPATSVTSTHRPSSTRPCVTSVSGPRPGNARGGLICHGFRGSAEPRLPSEPWLQWTSVHHGHVRMSSPNWQHR
jgi:pimeloyl-ACP methyl ester carboxylesterase